MRHPIRTARACWQELLGIVCGLEDALATVRSRRATKAENKELAASERNIALTAARRGCTHTPACPLATAEDRAKAEVVYRDDEFTYLCNGLIVSTRSVRDAAPYGPAAADEGVLR